MPSNDEQNQERNSTTQTTRPKPWQRQPNESAAAYRAFCLYRDLGPTRSLRRAYAIHQASGRQSKSGNSQEGNKRDTKPGALPGRWCLWSGEHSWLSRAEAYDEQVQCPEYQLELRRIERRRRAQIAYEEVLDKLTDNLATELPYLLFTTRTTTNAIGEKTVTRGTSPTALAMLIREIRHFEYVVQNGFQTKPPRQRSQEQPDTLDAEPTPEQPTETRATPQKSAAAAQPPQNAHHQIPIDLEALSAHLVNRLREQSIDGQPRSS